VTPEPLRLTESPNVDGAFPRLDERRLTQLQAVGQPRPVQAGDVLYHAGDITSDFLVIEHGLVVVRDEDDRVVGVHGPGRFLGELSLLTGGPSLVSAVVAEAGTVLAVPVGKVHDLVAHDPDFGDMILRACLQRRSVLIGLGTGPRILGSRFSADTRRLRDFVSRNRIPHRFIDLDRDDEAEALVRTLAIPPEQLPVVIWGVHTVMRNPSNAEVAQLLGLRSPKPAHDLVDLLVVGAGPAGLAAAVYCASEGLSTVVWEAVAAGGQAGTSTRIENYLGFPAGISGAELAERARVQADRFGAAITVPAVAANLDGGPGHYIITAEDGENVQARSVILAGGARYRRLNLADLKPFEATSVYYTATPFEAQLCVKTPVAVIGGGNSAGQAAMFLAQTAERVHLIVREDSLDVNMSRYLADRVAHTPTIQVHTHTTLAGAAGDHELQTVTVSRNGTQQSLPASALFVFIGADPNTTWLAGAVGLDPHGFVRTGEPAFAQDPGNGRRPFLLETDRPAVFAVGDLRRGATRRIASAVGDGAMAARFVHEL